MLSSTAGMFTAVRGEDCRYELRTLAVISLIRPTSSCAALRYRLGRASPRKQSSNRNSALPRAWIGFLSSWATAAIKRPPATKSAVRAVLPDCRRADEVRVNTPTSSRCGLTQKDLAYSRRADLGQEI